MINPPWEVDFTQLQTIIGNVDQGVMVFDLTGAFLFANRAVTPLFGSDDPSDLCQNVSDLEALFELFDPSGERLPAEAYPAARVLRGDSFSGYKVWVQRRGESRRWLGSYSGLQIEDSTTVGALLVRDVTARHELEARHHVTFTVNPTAMSILRLADLEFVEVNDSFLKLTGYAREEVIGHTAADLKLYNLNKKRDEALRNLQRGEIDRVIEVELELRTQAGEPRIVLGEGRLIPFRNDLHLVDTYIDITERKRAESELSQAIQAVMQDPTWFVRVVQDKLLEIRAGNHNQPELALLSTRERQVLEQLAGGRSNDQIAAELGIATQTVRNYISTVYDKIRVRSRAEAVVWARERGLIFPT